MEREIEMDYAVSIGEGTLLAYGKVSDDVPEFDVDASENPETFTVIFGPAIGTGE